MRIFLQIIVILALAVSMFNLTTGCSSGDRELDGYLERAEVLMEPSPDSAYSILTDSITSAMLSGASERQSALYALLLTQSQFKTYVPVDNDSLITSAAKYFEKKDDRPRLMKSLYYQARILRDNGEYSDAMSAAMHARAIAQHMKEDFWQARCSEIIAWLLSSVYHSDESLKYGEEAANLYLRSDNKNFYMFTLADQAVRYGNMGRFEDCRTVVDSIMKIITEKKILNTYYSKSLLASVAGTVLSMYSGLNEYEMAEQMGDTVLKYEDYLKNTAIEGANLAIVKIRLKKNHEALQMLEYSGSRLNSKTDSIAYYEALSIYYKEIGNEAMALAATESVKKLYSEILDGALNQSTVSAQRDYYSEEMLQAEKKAERNKLLLILGSVITGFLIVTGVLIYRNRMSSKNADISRKMTEIILLSRSLQKADSEKKLLNKELAQHGRNIESLSSMLSEREYQIKALSDNLMSNRDKNEKLNSMVQTLLQGRFIQLNTLINEYANQENNDTNYLAFYKNMQREIEKLKQPKNIHEIESIVNDSMDGVITKIREQIPEMRDRDVTLIALSLAGLNARAIGLFLGIHPNYTYRRKKQLIKIIEDSDIMNKDEIVKNLTKPAASGIFGTD